MSEQRGGYQPTGTPVDLSQVQPPREGTAAYRPGKGGRTMHLSSIDVWRGGEAPLSIRVSTREAVDLTLIFDDEGREERRGMEMSLSTGSLIDVAQALEETAQRLRRMAQRREAREEPPTPPPSRRSEG